MIGHYKSWSGVQKQLAERLADSLSHRITYFFTRYTTAHDFGGRAAIRLDGKELVSFTWVDMYRQEADISAVWPELGPAAYDSIEIKEKWNRDATFSDSDFLYAATTFLQLPIKEALTSDDYLIRILAIMDRRVGKRTLEKIKQSEEYLQYPDWVRQFYLLRLNAER